MKLFNVCCESLCTDKSVQQFILGIDYACSLRSGCVNTYGGLIKGTRNDVAAACLADSKCKAFAYFDTLGVGVLCPDSASEEDDFRELCTITQGLFS